MRRGFTLIEVMVALGVIVVPIFLSTWGVYVLSIAWWREVSPRIEAERIAVIALDTIAQGRADTTAGTDTVAGVSYSRRNGMQEAVGLPVISTDGRRIDFQLEGDSGNIRSFYMAQDDTSTENIVYYMSNKNNSGTLTKIKATKGISDLNFQKISGYDNLIKVTASVSKDYQTARKEGLYHIAVSLSDTVFLRSAYWLD